MNIAQITRLLHSRVFGVVFGVVAIICATFYYGMGYSVPLDSDNGFCFPSANEWLRPGTLDFLVAVSGNIAIAVLMLLMNKLFNVLRSITGLYISLFAVMQLGIPDLATQFYTGTVLGAALAVALLLLFSCYRNLDGTRRVFLVFFGFSALASTQYCYAVYLPVFLVGLAQMRVFNGRSLVAALLGLITPWWLLIGFGIVDLWDIEMPRFESVFGLMDTRGRIMLLSCVGFTALLTVTSIVLNVFKTIAYNAKSRAYNGALNLAAIVTLLAMSLDYRNMVCYIPTLNFLSALQVSHFFSIHRASKSGVAILSILAVYIGFFICQTVI